jgi:predicted phosphoribosyltransferase
MLIPTRAEAGHHLAEALQPYSNRAPVVLATSPGAARVGYEVALGLHAPLDLIPVRRLEVPGRPHSIFGAVAPETVRFFPEAAASLDLPSAYVESLVEHEQKRLVRDGRFYRGNVELISLKGRSVILVDDGSGDPQIMATAIESARRLGAVRVAFATPAWSRDLKLVLRPLIDHSVALCEPEHRQASVLRDESFVQTTWRDVRRMLQHTREFAGDRHSVLTAGDRHSVLAHA